MARSDPGLDRTVLDALLVAGEAGAVAAVNERVEADGGNEGGFFGS